MHKFLKWEEKIIEIGNAEIPKIGRKKKKNWKCRNS